MSRLMNDEEYFQQIEYDWRFYTDGTIEVVLDTFDSGFISEEEMEKMLNILYKLQKKFKKNARAS